MTTRGPAWTPDETALLERLAAQSTATVQVVAAFPDRSKASVLGKLHRLRYKQTRVKRTARRGSEPATAPARVDRDPCPRCGTRRDRGCPCPHTRGLTTHA